MRRALPVAGLCVLLVSTTAAYAQEAVPAIATNLPEAPIAEVRVEGNRRVDTEAILSGIETRAGAVLSRDVIRRDLARIYGLGYFDDVEVRLLSPEEAQAAGPVLVFVVREKPTIRKIEYEGNEEIGKDDLEDLLEIRPYTILDLNRVEKTAKKFAEKYREKGYYLASVTYRIEPVPEESSVDVVFVFDERQKVQVKEIRFVGNDSVPEEEIEPFLETREGGWFSFPTQSGTYVEEAFKRDLMRIAHVYYDRGFINVKVGEPTVTLSPDKKWIYVTIPIEEGDPYDVGAYELSGDLIADAALLKDLLKMQPGERFVRTKMIQDILALQSFYRNRGYAYVNVVPLTNVDAKAKTIDLTLDIDKGEKVYVERIEIHGNTRTRDKVIRREFRIAEGDLYSGAAIELSKSRVNALGYFENVDLDTRPGSAPNKVVLEMTVKERPTGTFQVGAGLSSGEGFLVTAQIAHDNLFGRGQSISLTWQYSSLRNIFQLQFQEPYFLDTPATFAFGAYNTRSDFFDFIRNSTGGSLTWGYELVDDLRLFGTYTLENVEVSALERGGPSNFYGGGLTSSLKLSLSYDKRDNRLFPTRGQYQTASVEHAPEWLGSENLFTRYTLTSRWYYPLPLGLVARAKGEVGYITGENFPISERYYLGGVFSLRGYLLRSISPTIEYASSDDPQGATSPFRVGGNKQVLFNFEIEFPLLPMVGVRGVLFYDMGNAYADNEPFFMDLQDDLPLGMFHSVGFGFRWFSPIGPLRFEWGIPLTPRPQDEPIRFEFTVGNFF